MGPWDRSGREAFLEFFVWKVNICLRKHWNVRKESLKPWELRRFRLFDIGEKVVIQVVIFNPFGFLSHSRKTHSHRKQ